MICSIFLLVSFLLGVRVVTGIYQRGTCRISDVPIHLLDTARIWGAFYIISFIVWIFSDGYSVPSFMHHALRALSYRQIYCLISVKTTSLSKITGFVFLAIVNHTKCPSHTLNSCITCDNENFLVGVFILCIFPTVLPRSYIMLESKYLSQNSGFQGMVSPSRT